MIFKRIFKRNNKPKINFASYPEKKVNKKYIDSFWEKYFDGTLKRSIHKRIDNNTISSYNPNVKIFPLSPTVAVTIRKIKNGKRYLELNEYFKNKLNNKKLKYSEIVISDIIDYKVKGRDYFLMERIIPGASVADVLNYKLYNRTAFLNRFNNSFLKIVQKMDKKTLDKMYINLEKAINELKITIRENEKEHKIDNSKGNIIIIDYNPNNGKFKLGLIDLDSYFTFSF